MYFNFPSNNVSISTHQTTEKDNWVFNNYQTNTDKFIFKIITILLTALYISGHKMTEKITGY